MKSGIPISYDSNKEITFPQIFMWQSNKSLRVLCHSCLLSQNIYLTEMVIVNLKNFHWNATIIKFICKKIVNRMCAGDHSCMHAWCCFSAKILQNIIWRIVIICSFCALTSYQRTFWQCFQCLTLTIYVPVISCKWDGKIDRSLSIM